MEGVACTSFFTSFFSIKALPALCQAPETAMADEHSSQKHVSNHKVMILCWDTVGNTTKHLFASKKALSLC